METIANALVVTRHASLVEYLGVIGLIDDSATVLSHATADDIRGRDVIGVLPHSLSCLTASFTEVPLRIPAEMRGVELTVDNITEYAESPVTYIVNIK